MGKFSDKAKPWLDYFERTKDKEAKVWLLSDEPSLFISSTRHLNVGDFGISIIDQFDGRKPYLLNYNSCKAAKADKIFNIGVKPTAVLDSQLITYFTQYLNSSDRTGNQHECIHSFLQFVVRNEWDFNPFFYYLESVVSNGFSKAKEYATSSAISVLQLHTMDEEIFLKENRITPDWKRVKHYAARYGLSPISNNSLNDIAHQWADKMLSDISESDVESVKQIINYTYAALLKMVLIQKSSRRSVVKKMQELCNFLEYELNLVKGREVLIAAYVFSNKLPEKFIQVQAQMTFTNVKKTMLSTARDFFLLSIPELQLRNGTEQETSLCYICSGDKAVRKLGSLFTIESVISMLANLNLPTGISFKIEKIKKDLGENIIHFLSVHQKNRREARLQILNTDQVDSLSKEQLQSIISGLEDEIKHLCKE